MHAFSVWAPAATRVDLVVGLPDAGERHAMEPDAGGWWQVRVGGVGHGSDYAFSVDGSDPTPDPRSPRQPGGVHAHSQLFDPARHAWGDAAWLGRSAVGAVSYEVNLATFTTAGTLDAAADRLPHLVDLGVDMVQLMPVAAFPGRHGWGYDGVHLYAVHEPYGGPAALQRFVDAAHRLDLGVCLDVVYNHLGPSGNYLARFGPYFTDDHHTPWGAAVNLSAAGSVEVRRWIADNVLRWFRDFHVDALRLDAVHALVDTSERHLLAQLAEETAALSDNLGRPLSLIAESDLNDPLTVTATARGGHGMTAQWSDDAHHGVHALLSGERSGYYVDFGSPEVLRTVWREAFWHSGRYSPFRGRTWGHPLDPAVIGGNRFVACASNHDQVGNRALGDRPAASMSTQRLAVAAALILTSPFTPMLFMGEEWGASTPFQYFTDFPEVELGDAITQGRRREFADHGWTAADIPDPQDHDTRNRSVLNWDEVIDRPHSDLLSWYRTLLRLRREWAELRADDLTAVDVTWGGPDVATPTPGSTTPSWLMVRRGSIGVVCVLSPRPVTVALSGTGEVLAHFGDLTLESDPAGPVVRAQGEGVVVVDLTR